MKTIDDINYQELKEDDISESLLDYFQRYQEVSKVWRIEDNVKVIKDISFIENWDYNKKQMIARELRETVLNKGIVIGVYHNNRLIGFASLRGTFIGMENEYVELLQLHVSNELRGKGIGKILFNQCKEKARLLGARKLYISGHSSVESQAFYKKVGCVDAKWIYKYQVELEPYDCQLEYDLQVT